MEDRLRNILSSVNDWLKFAEAKNAALFAVDSTLVIAVLNQISISSLSGPWQPYQIGIIIYIAMMVVLLVLSAATCLFSFLPQIKLLPLASQRRPRTTDNLLFFGDIAQYEPTDYLKRLYKLQGEHIISTMPLEVDYAREIVVNSRIALRKYHFFTTAMWLLVAAFFTPFLVLPLYIFIQRKQRD